jgi:hypothetical protein
MVHPHRSHQFQAVAVGHLQVGDDQVRRALAHRGQGLSAVLGELDLVAAPLGQEATHKPAVHRRIIDDQNAWHLGILLRTG